MKILFFMILFFLVITGQKATSQVTYKLFCGDFSSPAANVKTFSVFLKCDGGAQLLPSQVQAVININQAFKNGGEITASVVWCLDPSPSLVMDNYNNELRLLANQLSGTTINNGQTVKIATIQVQTSSNSFGVFNWTWKNSQGIFTKVFRYENGSPVNVTDPTCHLRIDLLTSVGNEPAGTIEDYKLSQNFPNPFNPTTTIQFRIKDKGLTSLIVYDLLGKEVVTLVNKVLHANDYEYIFDGSKLASGIYFYTLVSGDFKQTKKLTLVK